MDRVHEIAGLNRSQALDAVETLCRRHVLRLDETRLAFVQQLDREMLHKHMSAPRRLFLVERANLIGAELCKIAAAMSTDAGVTRRVDRLREAI